MAKLTVDSTCGELLDDPKAKAVLEKHMGWALSDPQFQQAMPFPLSTCIQLAPPGTFADGLCEAIAADLAKLESGGPEQAATPAATKLTVDSLVEELINDPGAKAVLEKHMGWALVDPQFQQALPFPLSTCIQMSPPGTFADGLCEAIAADLAKLGSGGPEQAVTHDVKKSPTHPHKESKKVETVSQEQETGYSGMRFKGKKAVVIGGAEGSIGQAVARGLGAEGAHVCIWDINVESAEKTAKVIKDAGGHAKVIKVNALEYDSVKSAVAKTIKEFGEINYMVDTVGGGVFKSFKDYTPEFFKQQLEFNGVTVFNCAHNILPHFLEKNAGKMVFFISATGGTAGLAGYQAGKAVMESLIKTMVTEVGKAKININAVMPGIIPTPLTLGAFKNMPAGDKMLKALEMSNPRGLNSPENVAALVLFILSKEADRLTGQVISMN